MPPWILSVRVGDVHDGFFAFPQADPRPFDFAASYDQSPVWGTVCDRRDTRRRREEQYRLLNTSYVRHALQREQATSTRPAASIERARMSTSAAA
jgi:hypothetical protein